MMGGGLQGSQPHAGGRASLLHRRYPLCSAPASGVCGLVAKRVMGGCRDGEGDTEEGRGRDGAAGGLALGAARGGFWSAKRQPALE